MIPEATIYEIDSYYLIGAVIIPTLIALILGFIAGYRRHQNREGRGALHILEKLIKENKTNQSDTGLALLKILEAKKIPDNSKIEIGYVKQFIIDERKRLS